MVEPVDDPAEPVLTGGVGRFGGGGEGADETEWIDLPPDRVAHPVAHGANFVA